MKKSSKGFLWTKWFLNENKLR